MATQSKFLIYIATGFFGTLLPGIASSASSHHARITEFSGGLSAELQQHLAFKPGDRAAIYPQNSSGGKVSTYCSLVLSGSTAKRRVIAGVNPHTGNPSKVYFKVPAVSKEGVIARNKNPNGRVAALTCDSNPTLAELNTIFAGSIRFRALRPKPGRNRVERVPASKSAHMSKPSQTVPNKK
jgi:hypothetical protein